MENKRNVNNATESDFDLHVLVDNDNLDDLSNDDDSDDEDNFERNSDEEGESDESVDEPSESFDTEWNKFKNDVDMTIKKKFKQCWQDEHFRKAFRKFITKWSNLRNSNQNTIIRHFHDFAVERKRKFISDFCSKYSYILPKVQKQGALQGGGEENRNIQYRHRQKYLALFTFKEETEASNGTFPSSGCGRK